MSLSGDAIRLLAAKGLTPEEIAEVADANAPAVAETSAERRRRLDRERKRRIRSAECPQNSADKADTNETDMSANVRRLSAENADISSRLARVEDNPSRLVTTGDTAAAAAERGRDPEPDDWPNDRLPERLIEAASSPRLNPNRSLGLIQAGNQILAWKRAGASWEHDVLPVVKAVAARPGDKISGWKFFDAAIGQSIADNRRALEIPEAAPQRQATGPPISLTDRIAAENAEVRRRTLERLANG